jgi:hypothetical protein
MMAYRPLALKGDHAGVVVVILTQLRCIQVRDSES